MEKEEGFWLFHKELSWQIPKRTACPSIITKADSLQVHFHFSRLSLLLESLAELDGEDRHKEYFSSLAQRYLNNGSLLENKRDEIFPSLPKRNQSALENKKDDLVVTQPRKNQKTHPNYTPPSRASQQLVCGKTKKETENQSTKSEPIASLCRNSLDFDKKASLNRVFQPVFYGFLSPINPSDLISKDKQVPVVYPMQLIPSQNFSLTETLLVPGFSPQFANTHSAHVHSGAKKANNPKKSEKIEDIQGQKPAYFLTVPCLVPVFKYEWIFSLNF